MKPSYLCIVLSAVLILFGSRAGSEEEARTKIGLVLGGGGALGFAHVGVLQVLEELRIPIDYIAGTSMGSIVAGMYASGMSPAEIEHSFAELDWWDVLKDRSPHQHLTYRRKVDNKRYMGAEFGVKGRNLVFSPGMAYGQKLNNVLGTFAINSVGISDYDQLNIPYRAVATDLRSGTSVALRQGHLAQSMRASMAVPGAFTPVRMNGMVFVDGGILNNIPVDVVKAMGADIVIAVDVGASTAARSEESEFNALGEVVSRTYTLMQRPDQEEQLARADLVIAPDLGDATARQFHRSRDIVPCGRQAAEAMHAQLEAYSIGSEAFHIYLENQRRKHSREVVVQSVCITGNVAVAEAAIRPRIRSKAGPLDLPTVYADLNRIHGMGDFQTVTYELVPEDDGYRLDYHTTEKFWGPNYLRFGMKIEASSDASMLWSLLLNHTRTHLNPLGGELRFDLEGGGHKRVFESEWYQPVVPSGRLFIAPAVELASEDIDLYIDDTDVADVETFHAYGMLDAGISLFEYGELRAGIVGGHAEGDGNAGLIPLEGESDTVVAATTHVRFDQLDDPVFATRGYQFLLDGMFAFEEAGASQSFNALELKALLPLTLGQHTLTPRIMAGSSLGTELPFYAVFDVGGIDSFAGYAPYQLLGNYYGVGSLSYRYRMGRLPPSIGNGLFAMGRFDVGDTWFDTDDIDYDHLKQSGLIGLGADTILGTCMIAIGKAESINPRFYFSIGNVF